MIGRKLWARIGMFNCDMSKMSDFTLWGEERTGWGRKGKYEPVVVRTMEEEREWAEKIAMHFADKVYKWKETFQEDFNTWYEEQMK